MMALSFRWRKCPWTASIPLSGIVLCLSQKGTFLSPVSSIVLHVHVKLHEMHMSYCTRCTCRTALHVHLKQRYTPRLHTLLYEIELYQYRRKRLIAMTNAIKFKTDRKWVKPTQSSTEYYLSDGRRINTETQIEILYFFILDLFPFAKICVYPRFNKDLNSVLLCSEMHSKLFPFESNQITE